MEKRCKVVRLDEASLGRVLQHIEGKKNVKNPLKFRSRKLYSQ